MRYQLLKSSENLTESIVEVLRTHALKPGESLWILDAAWELEKLPSDDTRNFGGLRICSIADTAVATDHAPQRDASATSPLP